MLVRNGTPRENPAREIHGKLTERMPHQKQDHHDVRSLPPSEAYCAGWDRIFGSKKARRVGR